MITTSTIINPELPEAAAARSSSEKPDPIHSSRVSSAEKKIESSNLPWSYMAMDATNMLVQHALMTDSILLLTRDRAFNMAKRRSGRLQRVPDSTCRWLAGNEGQETMETTIMGDIGTTIRIQFFHSYLTRGESKHMVPISAC